MDHWLYKTSSKQNDKKQRTGYQSEDPTPTLMLYDLEMLDLSVSFLNYKIKCWELDSQITQKLFPGFYPLDKDKKPGKIMAEFKDI